MVRDPEIRMHLGFCSNAFTRFSLEEAIGRVAAAGYRHIELLCDRPHYWPSEDENESRLASLRDALLRHEVEVSNVNANTAVGAYPFSPAENVFGPSLCSADEEERRARLEHARGAFRLAVAVRSPCVSITSGSAGTDHPPEAARERLIASLDELLGEAAGAGLHLGLEAEPGLLIETSEEVAELCEEVGHRALGFNLDVGHAVVAGEDPARVIRENSARLWHLHLEDIRARKHFHRIPGEGDIDFAAIVAALREVGFEGTASVELYAHKADPDAAARQARVVLGPLFGPDSGLAQ